MLKVWGRRLTIFKQSQDDLKHRLHYNDNLQITIRSPRKGGRWAAMSPLRRPRKTSGKSRGRGVKAQREVDCILYLIRITVFFFDETPIFRLRNQCELSCLNETWKRHENWCLFHCRIIVKAFMSDHQILTSRCAFISRSLDLSKDIPFNLYCMFIKLL